MLPIAALLILFIHALKDLGIGNLQPGTDASCAAKSGQLSALVVGYAKAPKPTAARESSSCFFKHECKLLTGTR